MVEERIQETSAAVTPAGEKAKPQRIRDLSDSGDLRRPTGIEELDRVLGGGIVAGSLTLVGGDPGIGKSTLLLSAAAHFSRHGGAVLYVSGEESAAQTGMRARRTGATDEKLWVLAETSLESILQAAADLRPALVIIDSIQTMFCPGVPGAAGSISQVREATGQAIGGVAPTGHPAPLPTVVDEALAAFPEIWAAGGTPHTVFPLTYDELVRLTGGTVTKVD